MTALGVRGLHVSYGSRPAVAGVDLAVEAGTLVALVGPNGSGKTTLLKAAAGLLSARGDIEYDGESLEHLGARDRARRRAYVAQDEPDPFPYRVDEVVAMGRAHRHRFFAAPAPDGDVLAALREVGFEGEPDRRYDALSGGERQLVRIARALVQEAPLLLLDEPTSHLDLKHKAAIVRALRRRVAAGAAVVWSVHDLALAMSSCDRLVVLRRGRVLATGRPGELEASTLRAAYDVDLLVGTHPVLGTPTVDLDPRPWR